MENWRLRQVKKTRKKGGCSTSETVLTLKSELLTKRYKLPGVGWGFWEVHVPWWSDLRIWMVRTPSGLPLSGWAPASGAPGEDRPGSPEYRFLCVHICAQWRWWSQIGGGAKSSFMKLGNWNRENSWSNCVYILAAVPLVVMGSLMAKGGLVVGRCGLSSWGSCWSFWSWSVQDTVIFPELVSFF